MTTKRLIIAGVILLAVAVGVWLSNDRAFRESSVSENSTITAADFHSVNPFETERSSLDIAALQDSLKCVDSDGIMTCGTYSGQVALYFAVLLGSDEYVRELLRSEIIDQHRIDALNVAAGLGDLEMVELLMAEDVMIDLYDELDFDQHPAIQAARFGKLSTLEFFVQRGLDINRTSSDGYSDLFVEAVIERQANIAQFLLDSGYEINCKLVFPNGKSIGDIVEVSGDEGIRAMYFDQCTSGA